MTSRACRGCGASTRWPESRSGYRCDPGQLLALEQLERRPAAGRDPVDVVVEGELGDRADGVAAADDRVPIDRGDRLGDRFRPSCERLPLEDAHRSVPEDRLRAADHLAEPRATVRADVEP